MHNSPFSFLFAFYLVLKSHSNLSFSFDQIGAMLKYLEDKYGERATCGDKSQLQFMRSEANRLEELVNEQREKEKAEAVDEKSEKGSEEETDEDVSTHFKFNSRCSGRSNNWLVA